MISVIIPVYNVEQYIRECLDSVISQTYQDLEILLVDDGSLDNSGAICEEYATRDERITVIHKENGGQSDAKNVGLSASNGDYIYFLDSDDYIKEDTLERALSVAERERSDIVFFGGVAFSDNPKQKLPPVEILHEYSEASGADMLIQRWENEEWMPGGQGHLFKAEFLKREMLTFRKGIVYEDLLFSTIAYVRAKSVVQCTDAVYFYRVRSESTMTKKPKPYNLNCFQVCIQSMAEEKKRYQNDSRQNRALDSMILHSAYSFMNLYGEIDKTNRKMVTKETIRKIRSELSRVKTISCRRQQIKFMFPQLWVWAYNMRKRLHG